MTVGEWLKMAEGKLGEAGVGTARLDALVLLEDVTGTNRARLLAEPTQEIDSTSLAKLDHLLDQRSSHMPLAYVRGKTEFYGREFVITPAVLEPRPESETMIDLLKGLADLPARSRLADVGTGSGTLGITARLELPDATVELLDISPEALQVAQINVDKLTSGINVIETDLLQGSGSDYDVLLCNLPYVPDDYSVNLAATHEPAMAIFGGPDGLDLYRKLFDQISRLPKQPLYILSESLPLQHAELQSIAKTQGYLLDSRDDFVQVFKYSS
jgi:release factor glutamine methyltransferase